MILKNVILKKRSLLITYLVIFSIFPIHTEQIKDHSNSIKNFNSQDIPKASRPTIETIVGPLISCNPNLFNQLENKIDQCCNEIINLITTVSTIPCSAIPIFGPISIEEPGYYCLNNDIIGQIVIDANNVVLDLNNNTVTTNHNGDAITVNTGINRIIKNGRITNSQWGLVLNGNTTTKVSDIVFSFCDIGSILVINSINLLIQSILSEFSPIGCYFAVSNNANVLRNIIISQPQEGFIFEDLENSILDNCHVFDGESVSLPLIGPSNYGFGLLGGSNVHFENCSVKRYNALTTAAGFLIDNTQDVILKNCIAQTITSFFPPEEAIANAFFCTDSTSNIQFLQCSCQDVHGLTTSIGFNLAGNSIVADYCLSQSVLSLSAPENSFGFLCTSYR